MMFNLHQYLMSSGREAVRRRRIGEAPVDGVAKPVEQRKLRPPSKEQMRRELERLMAARQQNSEGPTKHGD
jgi:hypothetical protein